MTKRFAIILVGFWMFAHTESSIAGWFGPSNYEECVLEGLKTSETEYETKVVQGVCSKKFPKNKKNKKELIYEVYEPELDKNGFKVCRVMSIGESIEFVTAEKLHTMNGVTEFSIQMIAGGSVTVVAVKKERTEEELKIFENWFKQKSKAMLRTCETYHRQQELEVAQRNSTRAKYN